VENIKPVIILGIQGSGKGTQSKRLCEKKGLRYIETGSILRSHLERKTEYADAISPILQGKYVSDGIVWEIIEKELLTELKNKRSFVLDGFPRTLDQGIMLNKFLKNSGFYKGATIIDLNLTKEEAIHRLTSRVICSECKYSFIDILNSCPACGSTEFAAREDDNESSILKRIEQHEKFGEDAVSYMDNRRDTAGIFDVRAYTVDASGSPEEVGAIIDHVIDVDNQESPSEIRVYFKRNTGLDVLAYRGASISFSGDVVFITNAGQETTTSRLSAIDRIECQGIPTPDNTQSAYINLSRPTVSFSGYYRIAARRPDWDRVTVIIRDEPGKMTIIPTENINFIQSKKNIF
jgi:adenylate kinase